MGEQCSIKTKLSQLPANVVANVRDDVPSVNLILNVIFRVVLRAERWLMRWINYPFGVSLFAVLRKPGGADFSNRRRLVDE
jgi:hypothetical protein